MSKINRRDPACYFGSARFEARRPMFFCAICGRKNKIGLKFETNGGYCCEECLHSYRQMNAIEDRRRSTIELRFGVNIPTQEQFTCQEIGDIFGVTFQSALNWERAGLEFMRSQFEKMGIHSSRDLGAKG